MHIPMMFYDRGLQRLFLIEKSRFFSNTVFGMLCRKSSSLGEDRA